MENVCTTEGKITATTKLSITETTRSQLPTLSITGRIGKLGQHLYHHYQSAHPHSNSTTAKGNLLSMACQLSINAPREASYPFLGDAPSVGSLEQQ